MMGLNSMLPLGVLVFSQLVVSAPSPTSATFEGASGYSTKVYNVSAATTTISYSYSAEELALLWDQIGPISAGPITTTVSPTPEPTSYPRPGRFHLQVPTYDTSLNGEKLPDDFIWGLASSAYQVEGAAKDEGKGPSIWDLISHRQVDAVADNSTGDVVASFYYLYKQDFARLANLGVPYFSPSFSWPRFFPFGNGPVNEEGVAHYDDLIASMVAVGIKPAITLFHWDTPLALFNSYGAWTDPQIVEDYFNYAKFVISRYDEYVPIWYTFNEPQYCNWQYQYYPAGEAKGYYPAYHGITGGLPARIACSHYTILAHAKVAKWYHEEFKGKGRISFKNSGNYFEPADPTSAADVDAVKRNYAFVLGWFGGPWTDGDYDPIVKETLGNLLDNYTFTQAEKDMIKGSCDFFAIDGYTGYLASGISEGSAACAANASDPNFPECAGSSSTFPDDFPIGPNADNGVSWLYSTPYAIRKFLGVITKELFPSIPDIVVSEFGFAEPFEGEETSLSTILWDLRRSDYYQGFLDSILAARVIDKVNVTGAFGWAAYDNFEWFSGSRVKFGLQYLNQTSLERVPKASMFQFLDWFKLHGGASLGNSTAGGDATAIPNTLVQQRDQPEKRVEESAAKRSELAIKRADGYVCDNKRNPGCSSAKRAERITEKRGDGYVCDNKRNPGCSSAKRAERITEKRGGGYICDNKRNPGCSSGMGSKRAEEPIQKRGSGYVCDNKRNPGCSSGMGSKRAEEPIQKRGSGYVCDNKRDPIGCDHERKRAEPAVQERGSGYVCDNKRDPIGCEHTRKRAEPVQERGSGYVCDSKRDPTGCSGSDKRKEPSLLLEIPKKGGDGKKPELVKKSATIVEKVKKWACEKSKRTFGNRVGNCDE